MIVYMYNLSIDIIKETNLRTRVNQLSHKQLFSPRLIPSMRFSFTRNFLHDCYNPLSRFKETLIIPFN
ncbi:hypothetical protein Hdeb2414_s0241g00844911 [Helianthus debilis subsp. tardiflorus]